MEKRLIGVNPRNRLKYGFSLIELSIVIIIVGLLISGIVASQALITSSNLTAFIRELSSYQGAMITFKGQYGYLPGDLPTAFSYWPSCGGGNPLVCNGNGDGTINSLVESKTEDLMVFEELYLSGIIPKHVQYDGTLKIGVSVPQSNLPSKAGYWALNSILLGAGNLADMKNVIYVGTNRDYNGQNILNNGAMGPNNASAVDIKVDDGKPGAGMIRVSRAQDMAFDPSVCVDTAFDDLAHMGGASYLYSDTRDDTCQLMVLFEE